MMMMMMTYLLTYLLTLRTPMRKLHTLMRKCMLRSAISTQLDPATCVATPTAPRDSPSITAWPAPATRRRRRGSNWLVPNYTAR